MWTRISRNKRALEKVALTLARLDFRTSPSHFTAWVASDLAGQAVNAEGSRQMLLNTGLGCLRWGC